MTVEDCPSFPLLNYFCYGSINNRDYLSALQVPQSEVPQFASKNFVKICKKLYLKHFVKIAPFCVKQFFKEKRSCLPSSCIFCWVLPYYQFQPSELTLK